MLACILVLLTFSCQSILKKPELTQERIIHENKQLYKINFNANLDLMSIHDNKLYFVDWNQGSFHFFNTEIKKFDPTFGHYGRSPKEYINVVNYKITDSSLISFDSAKSIFKNHGFNDSLYSYLKIPQGFDAAVFKKNEVLAMTRGADENDFKLNFYIYDALKNLKKDIKLTKNRFSKAFSGLSYNGYFTEDKKGNNFIFIPFDSNFFMIFDQDFNFLREGKTIYNTPDPNFRMTEDGLVKDDYSREVNINASIYNNVLYILTNVSQANENYYIDYYNLENSKYLGSYKLNSSEKDKPREILVDKNKIHVLYHESFTVLNRNY